MGRLRKWVYAYYEYLILIVLTAIIYAFTRSLFSLYALIPIVAVLIAKSFLDQRKAKRDELTKLSRDLNRLSEEFSKFTQGSCPYSVGSMAKEYLSRTKNKSKLNKEWNAYFGWNAYFDDDWGIPGQLSKKYRSFEEKLKKYVENPRRAGELTALIREFLSVIGLHYTLHRNFVKMLRCTDTLVFQERYNKFKQEYDEFFRNLRRSAPDFDKVSGEKLSGKFYFDFAESFPEAVIEI